MSTRWYPLYQRGNPQLRVFLPNFWMKLVHPEWKQPSNVVTFHCSMEMTMHDVQQYLEKIYNVYPVQVRTRIAIGKTRRCRAMRCIVKDDDVKVAYAILPNTESFEYPKLFKEKQDEKNVEEEMSKVKEEFNKFLSPNAVPGVPGWYRTH